MRTVRFLHAFIIGAGLVLLTGCAGWQGLTSPASVEQRAKLSADWATLRARLEVYAPELVDQAESIAAAYRAGDYAGTLLEIIAAVPDIAARVPVILADVKLIIADIRALGVDAGAADKADKVVNRAMSRARKVPPPKAEPMPANPPPPVPAPKPNIPE